MIAFVTIDLALLEDVCEGCGTDVQTRTPLCQGADKAGRGKSIRFK